VETTIQEEMASQVRPSSGNWGAAMKAARELEDYDFDAYRRQREYDVQHAKDHLV
jgi:hypothetical protein